MNLIALFSLMTFTLSVFENSVFLIKCHIFLVYSHIWSSHVLLPGLCNNNEKLGSPERLSAGIQFGSGTYFTKKYRVIVILFVCKYIYEVYFISFWCIDLRCIINYKLIYNNNNSFNYSCLIMKSLEFPGNNKTR
jgi:hypothetical protein